VIHKICKFSVDSLGGFKCNDDICYIVFPVSSDFLGLSQYQIDTHVTGQAIIFLEHDENIKNMIQMLRILRIWFIF
jgi:hypothetical protein